MNRNECGVKDAAFQEIHFSWSWSYSLGWIIHLIKNQFSEIETLLLSLLYFYTTIFIIQSQTSGPWPQSETPPKMI